MHVYRTINVQDEEMRRIRVEEGLELNSGGYRLEAAGPPGRFSTQPNLAGESRYLGVMTLAAG